MQYVDINHTQCQTIWIQRGDIARSDEKVQINCSENENRKFLCSNSCISKTSFGYIGHSVDQNTCDRNVIQITYTEYHLCHAITNVITTGQKQNLEVLLQCFIQVCWYAWSKLLVITTKLCATRCKILPPPIFMPYQSILSSGTSDHLVFMIDMVVVITKYRFTSFFRIQDFLGFKFLQDSRYYCLFS